MTATAPRRTPLPPPPVRDHAAHAATNEGTGRWTYTKALAYCAGEGVAYPPGLAGRLTRAADREEAGEDYEEEEEEENDDDE